MRGFRLGLVFGLSLVAACGKPLAQRSLVGRLEARWRGAESGKIFASAAAEWCKDRRMLEIRAIQGDTGLAMAVYAVDSIESDSYPVVEPSRADSSRPSASVVLRLFAQTTIQGYQADSGTVIMERSGSGPISGRLVARARSVINGAQIRLNGKFQGVVVTPQVRGCSRELPRADSAAQRDEEGEEVD